MAGTFRNGQPEHWHPDEASKVDQLITREWNFNHPQLLLSATRLALMKKSFQDIESETGEPKRRRVLLAGRRTSAWFAALAALALAGMTIELFGLPTGLLAGLLVAVSPPLVLRAHYFKEDTAFLMGMAVLGLGMAMVVLRPRYTSILVFGAGAGLASSAKYVGLVPALAGLLIILASSRDTRFARKVRWLFLSILVAAAVFCLVNFELFTHFEDFVEGFSREYDHARVLGHSHVRPAPLGPFYWITLIREVPATLLVFSLIGMLRSVIHRRAETNSGTWCVTFFPLAYLVLLSFSTIAFARYLLPTMVGISVLAAIGINTCATLARRKGTTAAVGVAIILAVGAVVSSSVQTTRYLQAMGHDSRLRLARWVTKELQPAVLYQDRYAELRDYEIRAAGHRLESSPCALAQSSIHQMRRRGVTHLIIAWPMGFRYQMPGLRAMPGRENSLVRIRRRYDELFLEGRLVWQSDPWPPMPGYSNPLIRVFDIRSPPDGHPSSEPGTPVR